MTEGRDMKDKHLWNRGTTVSKGRVQSLRHRRYRETYLGYIGRAEPTLGAVISILTK